MIVWSLPLVVALTPWPCLPGDLDALEAPVTPDAPPPAAAAVAPAAAPPGSPAPLRGPETARYRITYGLLGEVGEITLSLTPPPATPPHRARLVGHGRGSLLGLGESERTIETEFDPSEGGTHRWTTRRVQNGRTVVDLAHQHVSGNVALVRQRAGRPDSSASLVRSGPVLDPLGFVMRLRLAPPATPVTLEVLDGRGLWRMSVEPARRIPGAAPRLRLEGRAQPIEWDGAPDPDRTARRFTIDLADDDYRTPLALVMPLGLGEVRAELVALSRPGPRPGGAISRIIGFDQARESLLMMLHHTRIPSVR